jgi:hypothetical protein
MLFIKIRGLGQLLAEAFSRRGYADVDVSVNRDKQYTHHCHPHLPSGATVRFSSETNSNRDN